METLDLHHTIDQLPPELQRLVADYVAYLRFQQTQTKPAGPSPEQIRQAREAGFGELKGKIWMADDFNEPLADFADY
ncbi:type II toxin-antitoxin system VapB family antitoxin [Hymenobacter rubripertinctus]|uniref:DUF2281 domain-containing protein n=1 Tax=Hymenobacter rubripertinctus TaxID=2029981 RepID=A0A418R0X7_9BACT|nr:DUF2281 domain-containing protein [Hymenobacter rubripertinctus]RIY11077.1 DUF2281 domain-containing protein [Hymenobacter rubripertinctus]